MVLPVARAKLNSSPILSHADKPMAAAINPTAQAKSTKSSLINSCMGFLPLVYMGYKV
jgi:hypothetical protein